MNEGHDRAADAAETELADLERRAERLGDEIDETRSDWEAKKQDPNVPGAAGNPERADSGNLPEGAQ